MREWSGHKLAVYTCVMCTDDSEMMKQLITKIKTMGLIIGIILFTIIWVWIAYEIKIAPFENEEDN